VWPCQASKDSPLTIWSLFKAAEGKRFQNYRAVFSILDIPVACDRGFNAASR
jgi:transposase